MKKAVWISLFIALSAFISVVWTGVNKAQNPIDWSLPYTPGEYIVSNATINVQFTSGPHAWGNTYGLAVVNSADASGIDFAAGSGTNCGIADNYVGTQTANCSFNVRSIADGNLIYAGITSLGNTVAVRLLTGEVVVYGHLFDINDDWEYGYNNDFQLFVARGDLIGRAGGTGRSGSNLIPNRWPVHLHLELRDGENCSGNLCMNPLGTPLDDIGYPLSWDNRVINNFVIHGYHTYEGSSQIYNYDGVAIHLTSGGAYENLVYENSFHYTDIHYNEPPTPNEYSNRYDVSVRIPQQYADQCDALVNCENINLTNAVVFAGNGFMGGGGYLELVSQPGNSDPSNSVGSGSNPTGSVTIWWDANYSGTNESWSSTGSYNISTTMNDQTSSIQIQSGWSVRLFENVGLAGDSICLNADDPNFEGKSFNAGTPLNDVASSLEIFDVIDCGATGGGGSTGNDPVDFWENTYYSGGQYGNSADPRTIINFDGWANDIMSSIDIDTGYSVMVFTHGNGQGGKRCIVEDTPDLQEVTLDDGSNANNALSSYMWYDTSDCDGQYTSNVNSGDTVSFFNNPDWQAYVYGGNGNNTFNLPNYAQGVITSIGVLPGNSVLVFESENQQGGAWCFGADESDVTDNTFDNGNGMNDTIDSVQLFTNTNCSGWTPSVITSTYTPTPTVTATQQPFIGSGTGLLGEYYDNQDFTNLMVTRVDSTINFNWGGSAPDASMGSDQFTVRWTGNLVPTYTEEFTICTYSDDGTRGYLDNMLVLDEWTNHGSTEYCSDPILLVAGIQYSIVVEYYDDGWDAVMQLWWESASQTKEIIPMSQLYPAQSVITDTPTWTPTATETATNTPTETQVSSNILVLFEDANSTGAACNFTSVGSYNMTDVGCNQNSTSSFEIVNGYSVLFHSDYGGAGGAQCFNLNDSDFWDNQFNDASPMNDNVESLDIFADTTCGGWIAATPTWTPTFTETATLTPTSTFTPTWTATVTETATNTEQPNCGNLVSSNVILFDGLYCGGNQDVITVTGLSNVGSNDTALSVYVPSGYTVTVYKDADGTGESRCLAWAYWDLTQDTWGDGTSMANSISSVLVSQSGC